MVCGACRMLRSEAPSTLSADHGTWYVACSTRAVRRVSSGDRQLTYSGFRDGEIRVSFTDMLHDVHSQASEREAQVPESLSCPHLGSNQMPRTVMSPPCKDFCTPAGDRKSRARSEGGARERNERVGTPARRGPNVTDPPVLQPLSRCAGLSSRPRPPLTREHAFETGIKEASLSWYPARVGAQVSARTARHGPRGARGPPRTTPRLTSNDPAAPAGHEDLRCKKHAHGAAPRRTVPRCLA